MSEVKIYVDETRETIDMSTGDVWTDDGICQRLRDEGWMGMSPIARFVLTQAKIWLNDEGYYDTAEHIDEIFEDAVWIPYDEVMK